MNDLPDEVVHLVLLFSTSIELKSLVVVMSQAANAGARWAVVDLYNRLVYGAYWPTRGDKMLPSRDLSCAAMWAVLELSSAVSGLEAYALASSTHLTAKRNSTTARKRQTQQGPTQLWAPKLATKSANNAANDVPSESVCIEWKSNRGMRLDRISRCSGGCNANLCSAHHGRSELYEGRSDGTVWVSRRRSASTSAAAFSRKMVQLGTVPARVQFLAVGHHYALCAAGRHLHRLPLQSPHGPPETTTSKSQDVVGGSRSGSSSITDDIESSSIATLVASASDGQGTASRFVATTLLNAMKTALGASANTRSTGGVVRALSFLPPRLQSEANSDKRRETFVVLVESSCGRHWLLLVHAHRLTLAAATFVGHAPGATPGAPPSSASVGLAACWLPQPPASSSLSSTSSPNIGSLAPAVVLASSAPVLHVWLPPEVNQPVSENSKSTPPPPALTREGGLLALAAACTPAGSADSHASEALNRVDDATAPAVTGSLTLLNLGENLRRASQARAATHTGVHLALVALPCRSHKGNGVDGNARGAAGRNRSNHDRSHGFVGGLEGGNAGVAGGGGGGGGDVGGSEVGNDVHDEDACVNSIALAVTADGSSSALQCWRLQEKGGAVSFLGTTHPPQSSSRHLGGITSLVTTAPAVTYDHTATSTMRNSTPLVMAMHRHGVATIWCPLRPLSGAGTGGNITSNAYAASSFGCVAVVPCPVLSLGNSIALNPNSELAVAAAPNANTLAVWEHKS